jgi:hypothetical protein
MRCVTRLVMRYAPAGAIVAWLASASPADASVIWLYKEVETLSASVSVTGPDGVTHVDSHEATGALWSDPLVSSLSTGASPSTLGLPPEYYDGMIGLGSSAGVTETGSSLWFSSASGYGECNDLACTAGVASAGVDLTFRAGEQSAMQARYYPIGGTVDAMLADLTTGTILHQVHVTDSWSINPFVYEFTGNHLYRFVASGEALSPPAGDPYADFGIHFYDRVTLEDADIAPVPEPISLVLVGTGVAGMIIRRKVSRKV